MLPLLTIFLVFFILGSIVGSFLNVCIYRIPEGLSVVRPASRCPHCNTPIRWYHNLPILSWALLRGKCAYCKAVVSIRYPLVEALTGFFFVLAVFYFGFSAALPVYLVFLSLLVVVTFIDIDHQIIPNVITLPSLVFGFVSSFLIPWLSWVDSILGIIAGGGLLFGVAYLYRLATGKDGMGMGDVKLIAMIGAFLGWQSILPIVFVASLIGSLIGIPLMCLKKADGKLAIPFGPFLSAASVIYLFWWYDIFSWYQSLFFS